MRRVPSAPMPLLLRLLMRTSPTAITAGERVQNSGRTKGVDATVAERRRRARTGPAIRLPESDRVAVTPHRVAGAHLVTRDDLVATTLLLRVKEITVDRKRCPARADR